MLTGERRWISARRGSMTVSGKVMVPKPVNLPSQRLENHGLDPNVEIVPKGTLSWGSRSSSVQNAWGSAPLSPSNTDGGAGSPSCLNDRPSSGGSGTRPLTAGSERSQEHVVNVWGSSSRPSSASGVLASNQTSIAAVRPRSAETRPGSSQLSRFAEPVSENSVAWGAPGTMERLGISSSRIDGFSLSSGDFPTLGSEKSPETSMRQGHSSEGRPVPSSGSAATANERPETSLAEHQSVHASKEEEAANTSRNSNPADFGVGVPPSTDKWLRDPQLCPDPNMPPQQFGPWRGAAPHNPPNGVWYGGPPGGPPYGPPGPPGSYPIEPFYYHHRLPARPLPYLQPLPQPGSGPSGYHNGDPYRPHMPDSFVQPALPVGSGVYPVQVPYEGHYGPPHVAFCSPGERDAPIMGMRPGPGVYNRYPIQNVHPNPGNFHGPGGYDLTNTATAKEQGGFGQPHGTHLQRPYKVLLKQHDGWDETDGKEKREHVVNKHPGKCDMPETPKHTANTSHLGKGNQSGVVVRESYPGDQRNDVPVGITRSMTRGEASLPADQGGHSSVPAGMSYSKNASKAHRIDESLVKKPRTTAISGETPQQLLPTKRNPTLTEKIESLNNKAQISDGRFDVGHAPPRDNKLKPFRVLDARSDQSPNEVANNVGISTPEVIVSGGDKSLEVLASEGSVASRSVRESQASAVGIVGSGGETYANKRPHSVKGRADYRDKGRVNTQDNEEWEKKSLGADASGVVPSRKIESCTNDNVLDQDCAGELSDKSNLNIQGKAGQELNATSAFEPSDQKLQRAKMREIAAERAKQLQKEEEERIREQKARALAKLEELNRRTKAEISNERLHHAQASSGSSQQKQEDRQFDAGPMSDANSSSGVSILASGWESDTDPPKKVAAEHRESKKSPQTSICASQDPIIIPSPSSLPPQVVDAPDATDQKTTKFPDSSITKSKQVGYVKKQVINKKLSDEAISTASSMDLKSPTNLENSLNASSSELNLPKDTNITDDPSMQQKKRNNRGGKHKHKIKEVSSGPSLVVVEKNSAKALAEGSKPKTPESVLAVSSDKVLNENAGVLNSNVVVPSTDKESLGGANYQPKPQLSCRSPRNSQATRPKEKFHSSDAVVWAPVRQLNKNSAVEEADHNTTLEAHVPSATGHATVNNQKRRAEMERYVPKPAAKELSLQGSSQQLQSPSAIQTVSSEPVGRAEMVRYIPKHVAKEQSLQGNTQEVASPSVNHVVSDEKTRRAEPSYLINEISEPDGSCGGKGGSASMSRNGDSKHYKHGKTHGLWRERNSTKSTPVQPSMEGSCNPAEQSEPVQNFVEQHHTPKPEIYLPKEQASDPDNYNAPNIPSAGAFSKNHGVGGRGRKQPFKEHKGIGHSNNSDRKDLHSHGAVEVGSQSSSQELNQIDGPISLGESHVDAHQSSNWQPRSQPYAGHNRQGSRVSGGERVASQGGKVLKMEYRSQGEYRPPQGGEHLVPISNYHPHADGTDTRITFAAGVPNLGHQEPKGERKSVESSNEGGCFQDEHVGNITRASLHENMNKHERSSLGAGRDGPHNSRFGRGHETHHGGRGNSRQRYPLSSSSDRYKNDSHHEYQTSRVYNNKPNELIEDGSRATGSKYRERGQTHSRRGAEKTYGREE